jgi:hypothetical protein
VWSPVLIVNLSGRWLIRFPCLSRVAPSLASSSVLPISFLVLFLSAASPFHYHTRIFFFLYNSALIFQLTVSTCQLRTTHTFIYGVDSVAIVSLQTATCAAHFYHVFCCCCSVSTAAARWINDCSCCLFLFLILFF